MTYAEMVKVCAQAALMFDAAAYDWRRLLEIEERLWPLATELAGATAASSVYSRGTPALRQAAGDVRLLSSCLAWIRQHANDALETELRNQLDTALRCAMGALDYLEQTQRAQSGAALTQARIA
jgi:hypothetical protein